MAKNIMIVESSGKISKLKSFLGDDWDVYASGGHVHDLNKAKDGKFGSLGINKKTLDMDYILTKKGEGALERIKRALEKNNYEKIVLASDPDREGEAIAESLRILLNLGDNYIRCTFGDINEAAVLQALERPRKIFQDLVYAQDARRILDRVIGWEATSAASKSLGEKTPMGRVQSQAVKIIVDRELERLAFKETQYYGLEAKINKWSAFLDTEKSKLNDESGYWRSKDEAEKLKKSIKSLTVVSSEKYEVLENAPMPFDLSTLYQQAISKLGFKSKVVDMLGQKLYENGHITYVRTDSTAISDAGFEALRAYALAKNLPVLDKKRIGRSGAVAQEAHECIRPTHFDYNGDDLSPDEKALYDLIKQRCVASQLAPAVYDKTSNTLKSENGSIFEASGRILKEKGWMDYSADENSDSDADEASDDILNAEAGNPVPILKEGDVVTVDNCVLLSKKTKKPQRYNQKTLVAKLEQNGIGRPSTYTSIFENIGESQHGYVKEEGSKKVPAYVPSDHAFKMVDKTKDYLSIMDIKFTANMEKTLDDIANGKVEHKAYIFGFFDLLNEEIARIIANAPQPKIVECLSCHEKTLRRFKYKQQDGFFWKCLNEACAVFYPDKDENPFDPMKEFLNEDGSAKYPCKKCQSPLIRIVSKKNNTPWWVCSRDKNECKVFVSEKEDKQEPDLDKKTWQDMIAESYDADNKPIHPCPNCGKALVKTQNKKGNEYYRCESKQEDCDYKCFADRDSGEPVHK